MTPAQDLDLEQGKLVESLATATKVGEEDVKGMYLAYSAAQRRLAEEEAHELAVLKDAEMDLDTVFATAPGACARAMCLCVSCVSVCCGFDSVLCDTVVGCRRVQA